MKTEITITLDPTQPCQVQAALQLFQKLSGSTTQTDCPTIPAGAQAPPAVVAEIQETAVVKSKKEKEKPKASATEKPAAHVVVSDTLEPATLEPTIPEVEKKDAVNPNAGAPQVITTQELRDLVSKKVKDHRDVMRAKLTELGAQNVSTLNESRYAEFKTFLDSLA